MSDCCSIELTTHQSMVDDEIRESFCDDGPEIPGLMCLEESEAHLAHRSKLAQWAKEGLVAHGSHGSGDNYEACQFVLVDGEVFYASVGGPKARIYSNGNPDAEEVRRAVEYHNAFAKAKEILSCLAAKDARKVGSNPDLKLHTVHVYVGMRLTLRGVKSASHKEAMKQALEKVNQHDLSEFVDNQSVTKAGFEEMVDDNSLIGFLVDEEGDDDFKNTRSYNQKMALLKKGNE